MDWSSEEAVPAARSEGLVVERLDAETLIYDLERDEAHQLNATAAAVFELCDGRTTVAALAAGAAERLGEPVSAETVCEALDQLAERELLDGKPETNGGWSRRDAVRKAALVGGAAAAAPVVKSIVAPTPAQAQSPPDCVPEGLPCIVGEGVPEEFDCCPPFFCNINIDVPDGPAIGQCVERG
jgi:hypothetical protein